MIAAHCFWEEVIPIAQITFSDLEAFCMTCPSTEELTAMVEPLGFKLTFQMDACVYPAYSATPDLPAQYHYRTKQGTELIYLAGEDTDTDGVRLPDHASRFWLFSGADLDAYHQIASCLALKWQFAWHDVHSSESCKQIA